jgi:hypothetical protein
MKRCPTCQTTKANPDSVFCGTDGARLLEMDQPVAAVVSAAPPASLLMFFFANYFITQPAGFWSTPVTVPCQNATVNLKALALSLISIALWSLREQGLISIQLVAAKGLVFSHTPVSVRFVRAAQLMGLENNLLQVIQWAKTDINVDDVVYHYLEQDLSSPNSEIIEKIEKHAIHLGYDTGPAPKVPETGKRPWIQLHFGGSKEPDFLPDCERIMAVSSQAQNLQARWQQFVTGEATLYNALMNQCQRAVSRRTIAADSRDRIFDRTSAFD